MLRDCGERNISNIGVTKKLVAAWSIKKHRRASILGQNMTRKTNRKLKTDLGLIANDTFEGRIGTRSTEGNSSKTYTCCGDRRTQPSKRVNIITSIGQVDMYYQVFCFLVLYFIVYRISWLDGSVVSLGLYTLIFSYGQRRYDIAWLLFIVWEHVY